jgi:hypothetical protein
VVISCLRGLVPGAVGGHEVVACWLVAEGRGSQAGVNLALFNHFHLLLLLLLAVVLQLANLILLGAGSAINLSEGCEGVGSTAPGA